jgi:thiol:disulfide interchange protein DsbD
MPRYRAGLRLLGALCAAALLALPAHAAPVETPKLTADLIADVEAVTPGVPFTVGLVQRMEPHWHTYWKNPGDSGEPTRITWTLPQGFAASDIQWPVPSAIPVGHLMNYGYAGELVLPVTITPPPSIDATSIDIKAHATWLVCEKICIPGEAELTLTLPVRAKGTAVEKGTGDGTGGAALIAKALAELPAPAPGPATFKRDGDSVTLTVTAPQLDRTQIASATFFPDDWAPIDMAAPQELQWTGNGLALRLKAGESDGAKPRTLSGVLAVAARDGEARRGFAIVAEPAADGSGAAPASAPDPGMQGARVMDGSGDAGGNSSTVGSAGTAPASASVSLWQAILFALLGGLILNLMPCVLPILSLKTLTLAKHGGSDGVEARHSGYAYFAGVLASFAALAILLAALRSAGLAFGWGFQFQSPVFVLAMAALFFALGLSLSGVFDIGTGAVGLGEGLTRRSGAAGSFFTGVLASVAATPCTAPFMGVAIGFALTRPAFELMLVMLAMGVGFGLPVLAISLSPAARALLPRPGPWMETLKQALAFPLYATVAWLVWVLSLQAGSDGVLGAGFVLTAVGFAAWLIGSGSTRSGLRAGVAAAAIATSLAVTVPWLHGAMPAAGASTVTSAEPFSAARIAELRASGRPVFVNLTAAWCITCKLNERVALSSEAFRNALALHNVAYLKGDWTNQDAEITRLLKSYGRAGVPLYLLYPADTQKEATVLPQLLTETIVLDHFAALGRTHAAAR